MWADHLSIARCCACMAEHDLAEAIGLMGAGFFLLNRELILELWRQEMEFTAGQRPTADKAVGRS
ncbi:MAG: hypothetical protein CL859_03870 [Cyanobium sp. ARS6]|nr:hypothetical protein [Cyanobium sp. ARS6]